MSKQKSKDAVKKQINCAFCKKSFTSAWKHTKFCSATCRHAAWDLKNPRIRKTDLETLTRQIMQ